MASWFEEWEICWEAIAREAEDFYEGIAIVFDGFCNAIVDVAEDIDRDWKNVRQGTELQEIWEEIVEAFCNEEFEEDSSFEPFEPPTPLPFFEEPSEESNPACQGCSNYHGYVYNGVQLVCTMHPAGWDGDRCPDWETIDRYDRSR